MPAGECIVPGGKENETTCLSAAEHTARLDMKPGAAGASKEKLNRSLDASEDVGRGIAEHNRRGKGRSNSLVLGRSDGRQSGFAGASDGPNELPCTTFFPRHPPFSLTPLGPTHVMPAFNVFHVRLVLVHDALDLRLQALQKHERRVHGGSTMVEGGKRGWFSGTGRGCIA